jgi:5'-phosphate synthase pdxT subunit
VRLNNGELTLPAVFIRAPRVVRTGPEVSVLGTLDGSPVLVRQGKIVASSFHSELDDNTAVLSWFVSKLVAAV